MKNTPFYIYVGFVIQQNINCWRVFGAKSKFVLTVYYINICIGRYLSEKTPSPHKTQTNVFQVFYLSFEYIRVA